MKVGAVYPQPRSPERRESPVFTNVPVLPGKRTRSLLCWTASDSATCHPQGATAAVLEGCARRTPSWVTRCRSSNTCPWRILPQPPLPPAAPSRHEAATLSLPPQRLACQSLPGTLSGQIWPHWPSSLPSTPPTQVSTQMSPPPETSQTNLLEATPPALEPHTPPFRPYPYGADHRLIHSLLLEVPVCPPALPPCPLDCSLYESRCFCLC